MKHMALMAAVFLMAASLARAGEGDKHPYKVKGVYSETCTCHAPCACEMMGLEKGCAGVGAMSLTSGSYDGKDLSGLKAAYAVEPGDWIRIYLQPAKPEQRAAAEAFLRATYGSWGKIEVVADSKVDIKGDAGNYTVTVDDGKIMKYQTEAVLGADKKTPIAHTNINDPLNHTFLQGLGDSCSFKDGDRTIDIEKGRNAYFNDKMNASGNI